MGKFEIIQQKLNALLEAFETAQSHKRDITNTVYIKERSVNEAEYEALLERIKREKDKNERTQEKVKASIDDYKAMFNEINNLIDLDGQWLELPESVIKKTDKGLEVFDHKIHYSRSLGQYPNPKDKPIPQTFKLDSLD